MASSLWQRSLQRLRQIGQSEKYGLIIIGLVWLIFFSPIISGKFVYFLDDLKIIYYPLEYEYAHFQHAWQLPEWSLTFGFGQPLLGWGQLGFFTPVHLILRALFIPPLVLLQLSVLIYYALGLIGAYVFARQRKFSPFTSAIFGVLVAVCGFAIGHLNHVN